MLVGSIESGKVKLGDIMQIGPCSNGKFIAVSGEDDDEDNLWLIDCCDDEDEDEDEDADEDRG